MHTWQLADQTAMDGLLEAQLTASSSNKIKRREWAKANLTTNFEDVIWSDETSMHPVGITQEALLSEDRKGTETQAKVSSSDGSYEMCVHIKSFVYII